MDFKPYIQLSLKYLMTSTSCSHAEIPSLQYIKLFYRYVLSKVLYPNTVPLIKDSSLKRVFF